MIWRVEVSKWVQKQLMKVPRHVAKKLTVWAEGVQIYGLEEMRKISSYHDEPLHGDRHGQRSIRLNRAYRAVYVIKKHNLVEFVLVEEVTKHAY